MPQMERMNKMTATWLPRWVIQGMMRSRTGEVHHPLPHSMNFNSQAMFNDPK